MRTHQCPNCGCCDMRPSKFLDELRAGNRVRYVCRACGKPKVFIDPRRSEGADTCKETLTGSKTDSL